MNTLKHLFERNLEWATGIKKRDPGFFPGLAAGQSPEYLWIGCSDSRVPASHIVNLPPGEIFVHRNIANVVVPTDLNCLSVIQYAVEVLRVKHIIVWGHYGCGGVKAAMENVDHGLVDNWLCHIREVSRVNHEKLHGLSGEEKFDALCELNVKAQLSNVCNAPVVQKAWSQGQDLSVHGWMYDLANGLLKDLGTVNS